MKKESILAPDTERHLQAHHRDFEEFAHLMESRHAYRFDAVFWGFIEAHAPKDHPVREVVDLGTGPGLLPIDLLQRFGEARVTGVDAQPRMIERAERNIAPYAPRIRLVTRDLATPPIPEIQAGSVDLAIASMVLHEMEVPTLLLDECARFLRPGGVLIVYDWIRHALSLYAEGKRPETRDEFTHFSEHCRYTPEDLAWLAEQSGFEVLEWMNRHGGKHALFGLRKK